MELKQSIVSLRKFAAGIAAAALLSLALLSGCASNQDSAASSAASGSSSAVSASADASSDASIGQAVQLADVTVIVKNADDPAAAPQEYAVTLEGSANSVLDALNSTSVDAVVEDGPYGKYVSAIGGKAAEGNSGWVYTVNGEQVAESVDSCQLSDGDKVEFEYITM